VVGCRLDAFRVYDAGFKVYGLRVIGAGVRVEDLG
jgi:hypothetical protein